MALWAGFGAATVALVVLLFFQYRWLTELERSTALARRAILTKVLDVVSKEAHGEIKSAAEPGFHVDALDLSDAGLARLAARLGGRQGEAVRRLFVFSLKSKHPLHSMDPATGTLGVPDHSDETLAVWSAAVPWTVLAKKGASVDGARVHSDERDPRHRIPLRAVADLDERIVGLAGVIVDERYFAEQALPKAIRSTARAARCDCAWWSRQRHQAEAAHGDRATGLAVPMARLMPSWTLEEPQRGASDTVRDLEPTRGTKRVLPHESAGATPATLRVRPQALPRGVARGPWRS